MRRMKVPAYLGSLFLSMFFLASITSTQPLRAQAAGASVSVRMVEAIDSAKDPAGKQYRASVTKAVDAGNGVTIPQGAAAAVTLANGGSGWTTQLVSVTVNGQPVAVTSGPASMAGGIQSEASNAVSAVGSVLGSFGHHVKPSTGVTSVATGQRVVLPPGATLTFVLTQPPAVNAASPAAPSGGATSVASAPQPAQPSAAPVAAPGQVWWMCQYHDLKDRLKPELGHLQYYALFPSSEATVSGTHGMNAHFNAYVPLHYKINDKQYASGYCKRISNDAAGREGSTNYLLKQWTSSNDEPIHVSWTDTPAENAAIEAGAKSADAALVGAGPVLGPNQTYSLCYTDPNAPVVYLSDIFATQALPPSASSHGGNMAAQWNAAYATPNPFQAFLQKKYGVKSAPICVSTFSPTAAGLKGAQAQKQYVKDMAIKNKGQVVETGWKNTP